MTDLFNYLDIEIDSYTDVKQSSISNADDFYTIYLPETFKLKPRDDIYLDLKLKIQTSSKRVQP